MKKLFSKLIVTVMCMIASVANAQLIYGNTFPFWNVEGPLTVTGLATMSGGMTLTGATSITSPEIVTSITTPSTSFTALAGATTLLTLGGTGASASTFFPSTLDTTSSITGAIRTSGGISAAKAANFGTTLTVGTTSLLTGVVTASAGIKGTVTNDSAATTIVGELLTSTVAVGAKVATTTATPVDVTSVSLTAGDWDVSFSCVKDLTGVTATIYSCGLGTTTATQLTQAGGGGVGTDPLVTQSATFGTTVTGSYTIQSMPIRVSLAATTTIYLVAADTFSAGTLANYGTIRARRMR